MFYGQHLAALLDSFGVTMGADLGFNLFREFWPGTKRHTRQDVALCLNVLSETTVLTTLGRRALRAAQLSPKIHSQPPNEHKNPVCDAQTSADRTGSGSKTASPHPIKSPMLRRKAGDDCGVQ